MKCIGLSGYARSGKDSVAAFLNDYGYERRAFADKLREALYRLNPTVKYKFWKIFSHRTSLQKLVDRKGWDWAKVHSSDVREYLQRMGTEVGREMFGANFWVDQAMKELNPTGSYIFTDCRFPSEADAVKAENGQLWRIGRPGVKPVNPHKSETALDGWTFDRVIQNDGTLDDLRDKIAEIL